MLTRLNIQWVNRYRQLNGSGLKGRKHCRICGRIIRAAESKNEQQGRNNCQKECVSPQDAHFEPV
jgi:hypothetical protein